MLVRFALSVCLVSLSCLRASGALGAELEKAVKGLSEEGASNEDVAGHLRALVGHLRAGDYRLVRPSPNEITAERQEELAQAGCIPSLASALARQEPRVRALGAELVHLLTTNNPRNRAALAEAGVVAHLVRTVQAGVEEGGGEEAERGAEEAAEALWILAFNGGSAHEAFARHGAAPALAELALRGRSAKGRMWAGAALGNLAAAYGNVPFETSEGVRKLLVEYPGLVEALARTIAKGPAYPGVAEDQWPSRAHKDVRFSQSIEAWGAGQALKNLALSPSSHGPIKQANGIPALCRLKESPDWLEKMKAELTLGNLGADCGGAGDL